MPSIDYRSLILASMPAGFLDRTLDTLISVYGESYSSVFRRYARPEARNMLGYDRRAMFDAEWRKLAIEFSLPASAGWNAGRYWRHTRVSLAQSKVILTASHVREVGELVKFARFRNRYAQNQGNLFANIVADYKNEDGEVLDEVGSAYAILLHGGAPDSPALPSFASFAVPNADGSAYIANIDVTPQLMARLRAPIAGDATPAHEEQVVDTVNVQLKPGAKTKAKKDKA